MAGVTCVRCDACPKCGSGRVVLGAGVLSCEACGWHYLNGHPCRVCGGPSVSVMGTGAVTLYGCRDHPFTSQEVLDSARKFLDAVRDI